MQSNAVKIGTTRVKLSKTQKKGDILQTRQEPDQTKVKPVPTWSSTVNLDETWSNQLTN